MPAAPNAETRELRLAVALYGGDSLAIYMHGTTKELLVKAPWLLATARSKPPLKGDTISQWISRLLTQARSF